MSAEKPESEILVRPEAALIGLLAIAVADREDDSADRRTELILADVGLTNDEIALLMDKKPDAVRMVVSRDRRKKRGQRGP